MIKLPKMPSLRLDGLRALVTGASSGIGLGCAVALAEAGAHVVLSDRDTKNLREAVKTINKKNLSAEFLVFDLSDIKSITNSVRKSGPFDILVNSAGLGRHTSSLETSVKDFDEVMDKIGIQLRDPNQSIGTLSGGERQTVAIARAVFFGAKILILDEPTSALGVYQTSNVLKTIEKVREKGVAVVFISHNVSHALAVGDKFTVLSRGETLGTALSGEINYEELQSMMSGHKELSELKNKK